MSQTASRLGIEPDDADGLSKGIGRPESTREEKLHDRAQDRFGPFGPGNRLQPDLSAFEELDQANALGVFSCKPFVAFRTDELEGPQAAQALNGFPGDSAQLLRR